MFYWKVTALERHLLTWGWLSSSAFEAEAHNTQSLCSRNRKWLQHYCKTMAITEHQVESLRCMDWLAVYPTSKEWLLCGCRRAERSYSRFKVRRGGREKIPLIQGKEQWLCFAGAAVKRYPTSKVRETPVRQ